MRGEILALCLIVGAFTYAFRVLPTRMDLSRLQPTGALSRFLAATGPAAIATLFVMSFVTTTNLSLPSLLPAGAGVGAVLAVFGVTRSVVAATLTGSIVYGAVFAVV